MFAGPIALTPASADALARFVNGELDLSEPGLILLHIAELPP